MLNTKIKDDNFFRRWLVIFSFTIIIFVFLCGLLIPSKAQKNLYDGFIRFHVIANSNTDEDQNVKLKVRDAVIDVMAALTSDCDDVLSAQQIFHENIGLIKEVSKKTLEENNFYYDVNVTFTDEYYPERIYEMRDGNVTLPAGTYRSVRIILGKGEGYNWWCILFPPMCTDAAKAKEKLAAAGFTQNQIRILTEGDKVKYKIKFRAFELIEEFIEMLKTSFN